MGSKACKSKLGLLRSKNIISETLDPYPIAAKLLAGGRKNLVTIVGNPVLYYYFNRLLNLKGRLFTRFGLRLVDLFICSGDLNAELLDKLGFKNYITVYPFIGEKERRKLMNLNPPLDSKKVLTIAKESEDPKNFWKKGLDRLEEIAKRLPDLEFTVIGSSYRSKAENLHYEGWVKNKATYIKSAAVLLIPSRFDSFNVAGLECMAAGMPVIAGPNVGISRFNLPELVANGVEEMIQRLTWFVSLDPIKRSDYGARSRKIALGFNEGSFRKRLIHEWERSSLW